MTKTYILIFLFSFISFCAQSQTEATNEFKVIGKVKNEKTITLADLQSTQLLS